MLDDAGYRDGTEFLEELERRELKYAVGVLPQVGVWLKPPKIAPLKTAGKGSPPIAARYGNQRPTTAQEAARQAKGWRTIRWCEGSKGWLESRFWAARAQPSHRHLGGRPPGKEVWLLAERPESEKAPTKYCLCDLPADYSLRRIVRLVKCRWKIEQDYHQLKEELGLDHYEGRSWQGWHHQVTTVMVAHAYLTLETLRGKNTSGSTLPRTRQVPAPDRSRPSRRRRSSEIDIRFDLCASSAISTCGSCSRTAAGEGSPSATTESKAPDCRR